MDIPLGLSTVIAEKSLLFQRRDYVAGYISDLIVSNSNVFRIYYGANGTGLNSSPQILSIRKN